MDINKIKSQFPIFSKKINGKPLVYLDSSNSSQKPMSVLKTLDYFYKRDSLLYLKHKNWEKNRKLNPKI